MSLLDPAAQARKAGVTTQNEPGRRLGYIDCFVLVSGLVIDLVVFLSELFEHLVWFGVFMPLCVSPDFLILCLVARDRA